MTALACYPELTSRVGYRDRPLAVQCVSPERWEVTWRSGRTSTYDRNPSAHLELGYEPPRRGAARD